MAIILFNYYNNLRTTVFAKKKHTSLTLQFFQCNVAPKCECRFGGEDVPIEEQNHSSEVLAGAVGALGSAVVAGGGLGIWHLLKSMKGSSGGEPYGRSISSLSDESLVSNSGERKGLPPPYGEQETGFGAVAENQSRPPNIYRATMNDEINPGIGSKSTVNYGNSVNDW